MNTHFGPWATAINTGNHPQLSTFWRHRLQRLSTLSQSPPPPLAKAIPMILIVALAVFSAPTLHVTRAAPADTEAAADTPPPPTVAPKPNQPTNRQAAQKAWQALTQATHWRDASQASRELAELGPVALPFLLQGAEHESKQTREYSLRQLRRYFPGDPRVIDLMIRLLRERKNDEGYQSLRYSSVFTLGTWKAEKAAEVLREVYKNEPDLRITAAKSLAEIGETDVISALYEALGSDWYMQRYQANLGLKALAGKDLNDIGLDYKWDEGAFVSGGRELRTTRRPIDDAEKKAKRYQAIAEYCKWLKAERPKLYAELDPNPDDSEN